MGIKLFVGGLSFSTTNDTLKQAFGGFGSVDGAEVVLDRETGRSRGFGFVTFQNATEGSAAIEGMNGKSLDGRSIRVSEAQSKNDSPRGGGGGRGR